MFWIFFLKKIECWALALLQRAVHFSEFSLYNTQHMNGINVRNQPRQWRTKSIVSQPPSGEMILYWSDVYIRPVATSPHLNTLSSLPLPPAQLEHASASTQ